MRDIGAFNQSNIFNFLCSNFSLNPFHCDCHLRSFNNLLHSYKDSGSVVIQDSEITQCVSPSAFAGRPLLNIIFQNERHKEKNRRKCVVMSERNNHESACEYQDALAYALTSYRAFYYYLLFFLIGFQ